MTVDATLRLLDETRHEIDRADAKASILLGAAAVVASLLIGGLIAGDIDFDEARVLPKILLVMAATALALTVFFLGRAVYPQTGTAEAGRADYFTDHAAYATAEELAEAIGGANHDMRHVRQLHTLAGVLYAKYRCLQRGSATGGLALLLAAGAGLAQLLA